MLPKSVFTSPEYARLSATACKVLLFVHLQYSGRNNGDLTITAKQFVKHGFKGKSLLWRAKDELLEAGWLQMTRQGGLHQPSLFALTWEPIDTSAKYDPGILTNGFASNLWKDENRAKRDQSINGRAASKRGFAGHHAIENVGDPCHDSADPLGRQDCHD